MSFGSGISYGIDASNRLDRPVSRISTTLPAVGDVGGPRGGVSAPVPPREDLQQGLNDDAKARGVERQASDFTTAMQGLAIGNASIAKDYINNYGDERMNVSDIQIGPNGEVIVTPALGGERTSNVSENGQGEMVATGGEAAGKPFTFKSTKDFYTQFLGHMKPGGMGPVAKEEKPSDKSSMIPFKTGATLTLDDARQAYIAEHGKPDGMGGFSIGPEAPPFTEWLNNQSTAPVFSQGEPKPDQELLRTAAARAKKEASAQAGVFSGDGSDFASDAGNREAFITRRTSEIYDQLSGRAPAGKANPAAKGLTPPPVKKVDIAPEKGNTAPSSLEATYPQFADRIAAARKKNIPEDQIKAYIEGRMTNRP